MSENKNLDIETLRSVAIAMVFVAHAWVVAPGITEWTHNFFFGGGVDLFFAISGFVIASNLILRTGEYPTYYSFAAPFWLRRAFRLWPAAIFWSLTTVAWAAAFDSSGRLGQPAALLQTALAAALNMANFQIYECQSGVALWQPCDGSGLGHYWSLSFEEQFYLMAPGLIFFFGRRWWIIPAFAVLALFQIFQIKAGLWWYLRGEGLWLGVIIALGRHNHGAVLSSVMCPINRYKMYMFMALIAIAWFAIARPEFGAHYLGFSTAISSLLVLCVSYDQNYLTSSRVVRSIGKYIGSRSYSIYLVHLPVFCVFHDIGEVNIIKENSNQSVQFVLLCAATIVSLLFSEFSFRLIEWIPRIYGRDMSDRMIERSLSK